jgi:hypothetical protein
MLHLFLKKWEEMGDVPQYIRGTRPSNPSKTEKKKGCGIAFAPSGYHRVIICFYDEFVPRVGSD